MREGIVGKGGLSTEQLVEENPQGVHVASRIDVGGEWIELRNTSDRALDLNGCSLLNTISTGSTDRTAFSSSDMSFRIRGDRIYFDKLDLKIEVGERVAIIGPNGIGKTTLLRAIAGLETVTSGRVLIAGDKLQRRIDTEYVGRIDFRFLGRRRNRRQTPRGDDQEHVDDVHGQARDAPRRGSGGHRSGSCGANATRCRTTSPVSAWRNWK